MNQPISISAITSTSPLGEKADEIWNKYQDNKHYLSQLELNGSEALVASVPSSIKEELDVLRNSFSRYQNLDDTVLLAIYTARKTAQLANCKSGEKVGINIGSSRGATRLFESYYQHFLKHRAAPTLTSPTTTLGNISSWVAHDLKLQGPDISHSITCSTSLHAILNAIAWINSGMVSKFIVGGSESALTPFTISQMQALKIYSHKSLDSEVSNELKYPCRALDLKKKYNSMVLGEAAALACLQPGINSKTLAVIEGYGFATEMLEHNVSLSSSAECLQDSMRMALGKLSPNEVDVVVMHAPGTIKGDMSEFEALKEVFGKNIPALTTNKWKIGHCLGASGMLSVELAVMMLKHQKFISVPYLDDQKIPDKIDRVLVNAVGFGGNGVSILLRRAGYEK